MRSTVLMLAVAVGSVSGCHPMGHGASMGHGAPAEVQAQRADERVLSEAGIAIPIREGQTEAWRSAIIDLTGPRYDEYDASRKRWGVTSQTTFLQRTPMGDFAVIHLTGPDVHKIFHQMSESKDPWDVSWRGMTLDLHGMDFAKGASVQPAVEPAFSTESADLTGTRPYMFIAPIADVAGFRSLARDLMGARHDEYARSRAHLGIAREAVFLQTSARGTAMVVYWLAADPAASMARLKAADDPFNQWLKGAETAIHQMPLDRLPVDANPLVGQYPTMQQAGQR